MSGCMFNFTHLSR